MKYTITATTENKPGVLYRIADLFLRRQINIESLAVHEVDAERHLSRFTIDIDTSAEKAELTMRQMERIVEVCSVSLIKTPTN